MAHIAVPPGVPGIRSLFVNHPATARPMCELSEALLRGPSPLSRAPREKGATAHGTTAAHLLGGDRKLVADVREHYETAAISPKLKALLSIADKVRKDARTVSPSDIEAARKEGAADADIHDTVLIAAAFCMFNRYVDGLAAWTPAEPGPYEEMATRLARDGYLTVPGVHVPDPALKQASATAPTKS